MIHLIICGHAEVAQGIYTGARLLSGDIERCEIINFSAGMSSEELREKIEAIVAKIDSEDPILFLTDIIGGTPFRECATIAQERSNTEVISGVNLQILVEAGIEREEVGDNISMLAQELVKNARDGICMLSERLTQRNLMSTESDDDGI